MPRTRILLAAALTALSGCARCGAPHRTGPPEQYVPASTSLAVVAPSLKTALHQLSDLYRTLASVPAMAGLDGTWKSLGNQLGFDPLNVKDVKSAGLDESVLKALVSR